VANEITYDGGNPDAVREFVFAKIGPGRLNYIWGGMAWRVTFAVKDEAGYRFQIVDIGARVVWDGVDIRVEPPPNTS